MYLVLHSPTIHDLQCQVTNHVADGWLPTGGVTTQVYYRGDSITLKDKIHVVPASTNSYTVHYLQAVYKPQPKDLL